MLGFLPYVECNPSGHSQMDKGFAVMGLTIFCGSRHWLTCMTAGGLCHAIVDTSIEAHALRGGAPPSSLPKEWFSQKLSPVNTPNLVAMYGLEDPRPLTVALHIRENTYRLPSYPHRSLQISKPTGICRWRLDMYAWTERWWIHAEVLAGFRTCRSPSLTRQR